MNINIYDQYINTMHVQKRGNRGTELVKFDKITTRIGLLCEGLNPILDPSLVAKRTINNIYHLITTEELDKISANIAESFKLIHPDYSRLATRIIVSNLHKTTPPTFSQCMASLQLYEDVFTEDQFNVIEKNAQYIDSLIVDDRDNLFDYFGFNVLEKSYLMKANKVTMDRPQYMYMRTSLCANYNQDGSINLERLKTTYDLISQHIYIHATPTLFNAFTRRQQLISCFLLGTSDSAEGIMKNISDCAIISKHCGGIGVHFNNIRSRGSYIRGTKGTACGLVPQLKIYNEVARTFNQGGKRLGAFSCYIEPWHADIREFLKLKLNTGTETERARDLFYALWIPDLFMKRYQSGERISLFSEHTAKGLSDVYDGMDVCKHCNWCANSGYNKYVRPTNGDYEQCDHSFVSCDAFTELYERYETTGLAVATESADNIVAAICEMQRESGTPYICFKDHVNRQSNQKNIGTIKSSNLCTEIMEWSSDKSYACCVLASISLKKFVIDRDTYNYGYLYNVVRSIVRSLDNIIDKNRYPVKECIRNSVSYRPIGIGVQGLADVFAMMRLPFISEQAQSIDLAIFETIYYAALTESCQLAKERGQYTAFHGSPASYGALAPDMWRSNQDRIGNPLDQPDLFSGMYDWDTLRSDIMQHGLRNSLSVALMPTVSTSQILGNNESFEPFIGNIYTKNTVAGKFTVTNNAMINDLIDVGLWTETIKNDIMNNEGSLQHISVIPAEIKELYKTVWEIKQVDIMKRSALRSAFVDQSQSLNIHLTNNSNPVLKGVLISGWKLGLKTGSYYIKTKSATVAMKNNTVSQPITTDNKEEKVFVCDLSAGCTQCSS
jgi:ribonucleoside-diphosphate reductase alpha subunit